LRRHIIGRMKRHPCDIYGVRAAADKRGNPNDADAKQSAGPASSREIDAHRNSLVVDEISRKVRSPPSYGRCRSDRQ
jgi:hypothetical protein